MKRAIHATILMLFVVMAWAGDGHGWSCPTHTLIAREAGMKNPEYACIPDASRNENRDLLAPFHYHGATPETVVTPGYIDAFRVEEKSVKLHGENKRATTVLVPHRAGVLYFRIVQLYQIMKNRKYPSDHDYGLMNIAHFIGDLSQPLHNYPRGTFPASNGKVYEAEGAWAADRHAAFDDALENDPLNSSDIKSLRQRMIQYSIQDEADLKRRISDIANSAIRLARLCYKEHRWVLTKGEALDQAAMSASLLRAVMAATAK